MSISYKQLNHDISDIINNANNRANTIDYINEARGKIVSYYEKNATDIDNDVLLKMHKKLINDNKVINDNLAAVFFGLLGSLIFKFVEEFVIDEGEIEAVSIDPRISPFVVFIVFVLVMLGIAYAFSKLLDYFNNQVYNYKSVYIDEWHANFIKEKYLKEILTNPYDTKIVRKDLPSDIPDKKDNSTLTDEEALLAFKRKYKFLFSYIHRPLFRVKRAFSGLLFFKFRKKLCIQNQLLQLDNARKDCQNLQIGFQETIIDEIDCLENRIKGIKVKKSGSDNKKCSEKQK